MFKKFLLVGILVVGMTAVLFSEASAVTCSRCRSICAEELLKGLGNVNKLVTFSNIRITPERITIPFWCNNGDQCHQGPGNPFEFLSTTEQTLSNTQQVTAVTKNGTALVEAYYPVCEMWDVVFCADSDQLTCDEKDAKGNCVSPVYCPLDVGYNYNIIPPDAYPANGNTNWYPEPPNCDPNVYPLGSLDYNGDLIFNRMYVISDKTVYTYNKDGSVAFTTTTVDYACMVLGDDGVTYNRVNLCDCLTYSKDNSEKCP